MRDQPRSESAEPRRREGSENGSRRRAAPVRPRKLRRVEANNLVIYTTEPEVPIPSVPLLTEQELVSGKEEAWIGLAGLGVAIAAWLWPVKDKEPTPPTTTTTTTTTGANQPQQTVTVEKSRVEIRIETPNFKSTIIEEKEKRTSPATPAQPKDTPTPEPKATPTPEPKDTPTPEPKEAPKVDVSIGEPKIIESKPGTKDISQPDSSSPPSDGAGEKYDQIMASFLAMDFDTAEEAAIYLQQEVSEAGIEVRITERGYEVVDVLPDPAGVAAQLHAQGIRDKALIEQAVGEANSAIADVEDFVQDIQATIPTQGPSVDADENTPKQIADPFASLVPEWIQYVPSGFTFHGQGTATGTSTPSTTSTESMPRSLLSMDRSTPLGMKCQATVVTEVTHMIDAGLAPGYHVDPFVSVFDMVPEWSFRA